SDIRDFEIAKTPPTIDFVITQGLKPEYLPYGLAKNTGGAWGGWGDVSKGPDGCFYYSLSNHLSYGAESYILKYNPKTKNETIVLSAKNLCGWKDDDFGDGKIHGDIDFDSKGDTWMLTYFGPSPSREEWDNCYRGSWLIHYNAFTGKAENMGIPLEGTSWPYHNYDPKQQLFYGVDHSGSQIIVYDTKEQKMVYGGACPDNIRWYARCLLIDKDTGALYTTDGNTKQKQFIRYDRRNNTFTRMKATVPVNPKTGKVGDCRAHSERKDTTGAYWCFDSNGSMFKFWPEQDRTEYVTENWGKAGYYTANMTMSPKGRYLYYIPGLSSPQGEGVPVVQFNTQTGKKKVIAFIYDYYMKKYGYAPIRPYGIEIDERGESLFLYANGGFHTLEDGMGLFNVVMRRPAILQVKNPATERVE
ncbi:MAG: hypothetical protein ACYC9O_09485, partial [Candidatus Latescibacterota bacterium]